MRRMNSSESEYREYVEKFTNLLKEAMLSAPGVDVQVPQMVKPGIATEITIRILPKMEGIIDESEGTAV